jgi:methanogenic corrinoid protein MtbC1
LKKSLRLQCNIGELWENNEITAADKHLASAVCYFILSTLYPPMQISASAGRKKRCFCVLKGEQHDLGLKMVNSLFDEKGYETHYLGPNLPLEYAIEKAELWRPEIICLSISIVYHLPNIKKYVDALAGLPNHPAILIGGRIVNQYDLNPYFSNQSEIMYDLKAAENWLSNHSMIEYKNHTLAEENQTMPH